MEIKKVVTEDLGKIFEMAICLLYDIEYDGNYKYSLSDAEIIKQKLTKLKTEFPHNIKHTAKNGNRFDFTGLDDEKVHLSAKTTKKDGKICPQIIGQPSKKKFCQFFQLDETLDTEQIKNFITMNIKKILDVYTTNTFECPTVYYNRHKNVLLLVRLKEKINWENFDIYFTHLLKNKKWNESSSIKTNNRDTIGEFQIHKKRDNIKFRWCFEKLIVLFSDNFEIITLSS